MNVEGKFFNANVEGNNRNAFEPVRGRGSSKLWPGPYHSMATYLRYVGPSGLAMVPGRNCLVCGQPIAYI